MTEPETFEEWERRTRPPQDEGGPSFVVIGVIAALAVVELFDWWPIGVLLGVLAALFAATSYAKFQETAVRLAGVVIYVGTLVLILLRGNWIAVALWIAIAAYGWWSRRRAVSPQA